MSERDWDQFHTIKDLSLALTVEAAELQEIFRWKSDKELLELLNRPEKIEAISDELADILFFLARIAQLYGIDLAVAFEKKMKKNALKYPADQFRGSNQCYTG